VVDVLGVPADDPLLVDATTNGLPYKLSNASGENADAAAFSTYATERAGTDYRGRAGSVVKANPERVAGLVEDGRLLRHELTHFVLDTDYLDEMPQWASEGIAEYVGNAPARLAEDLVPLPEVQERIDAREVRLIPPSRWGEDPAVDYLCANAFAQFLIDRHGMARYLKMLRAYVLLGRDRYRIYGDVNFNGEGLDDEVLEDVYGTTPEAVARGGFALLR
jgi:hypothetical protein